MKRDLILLVAFLAIPLLLLAGDRTEQQMKDAAAKVLTTNLRRAGNLNELKEFLALSKLKIYGYEDGGFAVVSNDDRFDEVIGYSATKYTETMPCGFKWWLETINSNMKSNNFSTARRSKRSSNAISPFVITKWGQSRPFNDNCTFTNGNSTYKCVTGCVATALAQIMNYYRFPECGKGSNSYEVKYNNDFTITFSEDFSLSVYDWNNMLDSYEAYYNTTTVDVHTQAVAKLMKDCGVATNTRYSDSSHGSSSSLNNAETALKTYFNYDSSTQLYKRSDYSSEEWMNIIYQEIGKGRPILYSGTEGESIASSGHAFILNGYDNTGKIFINWGWDGSYEGYYDMDLLNPASYHYNYNQSMVIAVPSTSINTSDITITANGAGSVNYGRTDGAEVRQSSKLFKIIDGNDVTIYFIPDIGHKIKSVTINGSDVTSILTNNQYTLNNVHTAINVVVEFEEIEGYLTGEYNMFITCIGGSISTTQTSSNITTTIGFAIENSGKEKVFIKKLVVKDPDSNSLLFSTTDTNVLGNLDGNSKKSLSLKMNQQISKIPTFELEYTYNNTDYAYIASNYKVLSITTNKYGSVAFSGISIKGETKKFSIVPGNDAVIEINSNEGCVLHQLKINDTDETTNVSNNNYTIHNISSNTSVNATFDIFTDDQHSLNGHEYVDLGLTSGKYWSTKNYGADSPEEAGDYLSDTYINLIGKYWGEDWRTPTKEEFQELIDECEWTWTERNGHNGYNIKGPNGNTMFLPAAGKKDIISVSQLGTYAYYYTSTEGSYSVYKWILQGNASSTKLNETLIVTDNYPIRPISTYEPQTYKLTYIIDGEEFKSFSYKEGATITPEEAPTKEGYTFSGWSEIPATMPAHDVTVTGTFTINKYKLTYMVDGEIYKSYDVEFGATITPEPAPTKEGYNFSGWSEIPATMPAHDVTVTGTFTIVDPVTITAKSYSRKYGEANPTFEYTSEGATLTGTPEITCEATVTSPVGEYPIVISKGTVTNYNDHYVNGVLTITKAPLTITAKDYTIKQGDALPTFEAEYAGFKNNETNSVLTTQPTIRTTATSASEPGTYEITISGASATNYDITYVKGTLTITKADEVVVTAKSYSRKYGEANPTFEYTTSGATLTGTPSISCSATATSPVGEYDIVVSKGSVTNYNVTLVNGKLTVTKAPLTITAKSYSIKQGDALPTFEAEYSGFKNNETSAVLTSQPTIRTTATSASEPGTYEIVVSGASATNYDISYVKGTLTISAVEVEPVTETGTTTFSEDVNENTDLSNTIIDNTYYTMNAENGDGYDATEQAIVLNSTTTTEQMNTVQNAQVGDATMQANYNGIIFEVPAGSGTITVEVKTIGSHVLNVQIGNGAPNKITKSERGTVDVPYNVTAPTYVYLYASTSGASGAPKRAAAANSVLLYSYKVTVTVNGISVVTYGDMENAQWYDLNGCKLQGKPTKKGLYIVNGRKVIVK